MKIKEIMTIASRVCYDGAEACQRYLARLNARGVGWGSMPVVVYRCREKLSNYVREYEYFNNIVLANATTEAFNDYSVVFKEYMTRDLDYIYAVLAELLSIQNRTDVSVFFARMFQTQNDIIELKKMLENVEDERKDEQGDGDSLADIDAGVDDVFDKVQQKEDDEK